MSRRKIPENQFPSCSRLRRASEDETKICGCCAFQKCERFSSVGGYRALCIHFVFFCKGKPPFNRFCNVFGFVFHSAVFKGKKMIKGDNFASQRTECNWRREIYVWVWREIWFLGQMSSCQSFSPIKNRFEGKALKSLPLSSRIHFSNNARGSETLNETIYYFGTTKLGTFFTYVGMLKFPTDSRLALKLLKVWNEKILR